MSDQGRTDPGKLPEMFELEVTARQDRVEELLRRFPVDVGCRHPHSERNKDGTLTVLVYASDELIGEIEAAGYAVKRGESVSAAGRERQSEVGKGDRSEGGRTHPEGLGKLDGDTPERSAP